MNTDTLTLFIYVAKLNSFTKAAARCNASPSKVTRTIQALEEHVGAPLLERNNRSVTLTAEGLSFLNYAQDALRQWQTFQETLYAENNDLRGSLSIYCSVTASYSFLYDILTKFRDLHPKIEIHLHTGDPADAVERISTGLEDVAIAAKDKKMPKDIMFKSFTSSPLIFISPLDDTAFTKNNNESLTEFWKRIPLIISERGLARDRLNAWLNKLRLEPNIYAQVAGHEAIVSMVSLGFGVGLVPEIVVRNSPLSEKVKHFSYQASFEDYDVGICVQESRLKSPVVKALWSTIKN